MPNKTIRDGLIPLAWGAVLFLLIAAVLLMMRPSDAPIPADAIYVLTRPHAIHREVRI